MTGGFDHGISHIDECIHPEKSRANLRQTDLGTMYDHDHFMNFALAEARKALDEGEFPVGCVFVADGRVIAKGRRRNSSGPRANELDHAEMTALRTMLQIEPLPQMNNVTVYSTMEPCLMCFSAMLLSGIRTFVWAYEDVMGGGTNLPVKKLHPLYAEMNISLNADVRRLQSLRLFQLFFRDHTYWQDSLLASYTLKQKTEK